VLALIGFLVAPHILRWLPDTGAAGNAIEINRRAGTPANADKAPNNLWKYNGSILLLEESGNLRRFRYVEPRPGLRAKSSDVAFDGFSDGLTYLGRAFLFSANCGAIAYPVAGTISPNETTIRMRGRRPRRNPLCAVVGYTDEELVFSMA
jgi:hypothetical protein